jgi:hypothetical protein
MIDCSGFVRNYTPARIPFGRILKPILGMGWRQIYRIASGMTKFFKIWLWYIAVHFSC